MKTTRQQLHVALRLFAGLLFIFMASTASVAHPPPPTTSWVDANVTEIVNAVGHDGSTAAKAILIKDAAELAYFAKQVNAGGLKLNLTYEDDIDNSDDDKKGFAGYHFALSADIELGGHDWTPIGINISNSFKGHFDGDGHIVNGLKVSIESTAAGEVYAGLFGYVSKGTFRNLGVRLSPEGITGSSNRNSVYAGGLAGWIKGSDGTDAIRNCYVDAEENGAVKATVTVAAYANAGGIVGYLSGGTYSVTHCYATVDVKATSSSNSPVYAGGISGEVGRGVIISYTYATGKVEGEGEETAYTGGICGFLDNSTITNSLALNKEISGKNNENGRITGYISGRNSTSSNYATPQMTLNGSPATGGTTADANGANTWSNTFEADLKREPSPDNEWEKAWSWPAAGSGQLPKLKKVTDSNTYGDELNGQTGHPVAGILTHSPWAMGAATEIENLGGGNGIDAPILIATAEELAYFAQQVNDGGLKLDLTNGIGISNSDVAKKGFSDYHFALSNDIELGGYDWTPIGNKDTNPFAGHFDGAGHVVKGLKVSIESATSDQIFAGLFGIVWNGTLRNLGVWLSPEGITASSSRNYVYAGGLAGWITGSADTYAIRNCYVEAEGNGAVRGTTAINVSVRAGGIVGFLDSPSMSSETYSVTHCYATVDVKATSSGSACAGGIAGYVRSGVIVSYTYATGKVEGEGGRMAYTGGICGYLDGDIITNSLALNQSVGCTSSEGSTGINRIAGIVYGSNNTISNYATPQMTLNGSPATGGTTDDANGADTWLDTFADDLLIEPATDNGWASGNWTWLPTPGNLPQLRRVTLDDGGVATGNADWQTTQTSLPASNYLTNKPVPPTPPVPEPDPEPTPPPVYYTVTLPVVEGAATDPVAGQYLVEAWDTFRFYLTVDTAYSASEPVIGTSRYETLLPRSSDGAYLVKYVRTDVEVYIDGLVKNPDPVANEAVASQVPKVWATRGVLHISSPTEQTVQVYNLAGARVKQTAIPVGDTRWQLPQGVYIVQIATARYKVIL